ncbi:MAG: hypothetical protein E6K81_13465 [Candidatus Eisenbacteria bacterium]|uniref:L,D-TPase catalytic domain-containing protein n=1 Tax=Eiseniibacteriota bacterium TaxID=2212470 RepID=A0A538U2D4_UNCEI|nr:MAG: hypothetical protein E6K81_13465 [Candidatus Eisenbacteria bacterium]
MRPRTQPDHTGALRRRIVPGAGASVLALGLLLLALGLSACESELMEGPGGPRTSTREELRKLLEGGWAALSLPDTTGADSTWAWVKEFYARRKGRPAWGGRSPNRGARRLVEALPRLNEAGLDPGDYDTERLARLLRRATSNDSFARATRSITMARLDVRATYALLRAAPHLREGRIPRGLLDPDWLPAGTAVDWLTRLEREADRDPAKLFAELEPNYDGYRRLRGALARCRAIAAAGGWPELPSGPPITLGATGPRVGRLIRRLALSGDLPEPVRDTVFDARLVRAIGEFQVRNGIPLSGVVGEATRALLNVPVEARIRQIELNLERWRWLPDSLGRRRVEINIPAFHLELIDQERVMRGMRVVVGKRSSPTPVFSDAVVYVEVNPTWTLPPSVVQKEIVPALRKKRNYLSANRMFVVSIARATRDTVDSREVPWKEAASDSFPYLVIQSAGRDNPLGQVKLMCPNEYDVYLHDSPQRSRFGVASRDYSHGCVRLEEAVTLADSLLAPVLGDSVTVDSLIARGTWRRVRLAQPMPVHFLRDDLYGLDARLDRALRTHTPARFVLNPDVEVSPPWLAAQAQARELAGRAAAARALRRSVAR